jgi:PAN domain
MASAATPMATGAPPSKTPLIIGAVVFLVILVAAYYFMTRSSSDSGSGATPQVTSVPPPPPPVTAPPTVTAAAPAPNTSGYVGPFNGFDYPGNDLGNWSNADPTFCAGQCSKTPGCVGYIVSTTGQGCYAKSKFENPQASPTSNVYTKPGTVIPNSAAKYQAPVTGHYSGNELATFTNNDPNYCASQCDANSTCVAFETSATDCRTKAQLTNPIDSTQTSVKVYAKQGVQAVNATTQPGGSAGAPTPNYGLPGLTVVPFGSVPKQFYIKNANTGKWLWAGPDGAISEVDTAATQFTADKPGDLYSQSGDGNLVRIGTGSGYMRHSNFVLWSQQYAPANYDFAWEFFTNGNSQFFMWNPYPGDTMGAWLQSATDGSGRPRIVPKATVAQAYILVGPGTPGVPSGAMMGNITGYAGPMGGQDYPGNDIAQLPIGDATGCSQKCDGTNGCVGFVMASDSQNCWLKSSFGQATQSSVRPTYTRQDTLSNNQRLKPGESITSRNGHWKFTYQTDANVVLYDTRSNAAKWAMQTVNGAYGYPPGYLTMQGDGNLVAYDSSNGARWASGSNGKGTAPYRLVAQNDGNVVIYDANGVATWATNTWQWPWTQ